MKVFLYEFTTGGGMLSLAPNEVPPASLLREGAAMLAALAMDFSNVQGTEVIVFHDRRLAGFKLPEGVRVVEVGSAADESALLTANASAADWTMVIAPEIGECLLQRVRQVERAGGRLLSPSSAAIVAAQNKNTTLRQLEQQGIATPRGGRFRSGFPLPKGLQYPVVIKPLDGAGSIGLELVESASTVIQLPAGRRFRIEELCHGLPASVSVLCGPRGHVILPPSRQHLSDDRTLRYLGGTVPLGEPFRERAERLALAVTRAALLDVGYVGIDMVLAERPAARDVVIEINPRLTTSYVGLRQLAHSNLAAAMLEVAEGRTADLCFGSDPIEFSADGTIRPAKLGQEKTS